MDAERDMDGSDGQDYPALLARADEAWSSVPHPSPPMLEVREHLESAVHHNRLAHLVLGR